MTAAILQDVSRNILTPPPPTATATAESKLGINLPFVDLRSSNYGLAFVLHDDESNEDYDRT